MAPIETPTNSDGSYTNPNTIVRHYHKDSDLTGDLGWIETADGTEWQVVRSHSYQGTGDRRGTIVGGVVIE